VKTEAALEVIGTPKAKGWDMESYRHAREKLYLAASSLATKDGSVRERLKSAGLTLITMHPDGVPPEHLAEFESIRTALTTDPAENEGEGTLHATLRNMTAEQGCAIAERIFELFIRVRGGI
jgi:hypothetical protein